jgi:hypothetical protein
MIKSKGQLGTLDLLSVTSEVAGSIGVGRALAFQRLSNHSSVCRDAYRQGAGEAGRQAPTRNVPNTRTKLWATTVAIKGMASKGTRTTTEKPPNSHGPFGLSKHCQFHGLSGRTEGQRTGRGFATSVSNERLLGS